jgi:hypothetical protein
MLPMKIFLQVEAILPQDKPELGISAKDKLYFDTSPEVSIKGMDFKVANALKGFQATPINLMQCTRLKVCKNNLKTQGRCCLHRGLPE